MKNKLLLLLATAPFCLELSASNRLSKWYCEYRTKQRQQAYSKQCKKDIEEFSDDSKLFEEFRDERPNDDARNWYPLLDSRTIMTLKNKINAGITAHLRLASYNLILRGLDNDMAIKSLSSEYGLNFKSDKEKENFNKSLNFARELNRLYLLCNNDDNKYTFMERFEKFRKC